MESRTNTQSENVSGENTTTKNTEKKWAAYFLEFLMIFIAITLGLIAENLSYRVNKSKEKEFMVSLKEDIPI